MIMEKEKSLNIFSFCKFSNWGPLLGSLIFHLAAASAVLSFVINTIIPKEQPPLSKPVMVNIAYIPPSVPAISTVTPEESVKQKLKSKGKIPVKKQYSKQEKKPLTKAENLSDAKPVKNNAILPVKPVTDDNNKAIAKDSGANKEYNAALLAWLEQHKHYPRQARLARMEGNAIISFTIDREGKVLNYHLVQSTGHYVLDDAVIKMIMSATPMPIPLNQLSSTELNFTLPVSFALN